MSWLRDWERERVAFHVAMRVRPGLAEYVRDLAYYHRTSVASLVGWLVEDGLARMAAAQQSEATTQLAQGSVESGKEEPAHASDVPAEFH